MLDDGTYDAIVVDAEARGDGVSIELAITSGAHKGDVVRVHATSIDTEPLLLLGTPATLRVAAGVPTVTLD